MPLPSSEYFTEKAEENKENQKQAEEETEATLPLPSDAPSATALPGKKKAAKAGFSLFGFNVFL